MINPQDKARLEQLFRAQYATLVGVSARITKDQALSEDIVQNVFLKFYEKNGLVNAENPVAYLRRSVVTRTINAIRDRKRVDHPGDIALASAIEQTEEEITPDLDDVKRKLHLAIDALPERARLILVLNRFEGMSYKEIAAELDISPKTVENQLSRALKLIRMSLPKLLTVFFTLSNIDF